MISKRELEIWRERRTDEDPVFVDECIEAAQTRVNPDFGEPMDIGGGEIAIINQLVEIAEVTSIKFKRSTELMRRQPRAPDIREVFEWVPPAKVLVRMEKTRCCAQGQGEARAESHQFAPL
jgi:hypothetical protein